jgi:hypothetical protein
MSVKNCSKCGNEFKAVTNKKYCDKCLTHKCIYCGNSFTDKNQINRKYCCLSCSIKDKENPNPPKKKIQKICLYCNKTFFVHQYRHDAKYCSQRCLAKSKTGNVSKNWKGGITSENLRIRNSEEMKNWRTQVLERDNYTCQKCGQVGGVLNIHHIIPFSADKTLRFEVSNGITLCFNCHKKEHKRLRKISKGQIDIFQVKKGEMNVDN